MSDTLFDLSQYKSEATQKYSPDWRDATGTDSSWDEPSLKQNQEPSIQGSDSNALTAWESAAEFTITLESGQTVEVKFVPGVEGELTMHQFDFTGPVSPTGFKSHFVLAVETEQFPHPCDYAQAYAQKVVAQFAEKQHMPPSKKRSRSHKEMIAPQELLSEQDNSTLESTMAENETTQLNQTPVEVVEELSKEEAADRQRLELKVERAFYEAGSGLRELRDRRLYRNTHKTWEEYCFDRFGFKRHAANLKIAASGVFENLVTKSHQILPTKETQVRPLTKLEPEEQCTVWQQAVEAAGGKVPTEGLVKDTVLRHKGIVEQLKEKNPLPTEFAAGDVIKIKVLKRSPLHPLNGIWGIVEHIGSFSYTVRISIARDTQQCKGEEMTKIEDEYTTDIKSVSKRIATLVQFELEPVEYAILEVLQRSICFTPRQLLYLERMESDYGLLADSN